MAIAKGQFAQHSHPNEVTSCGAATRFGQNPGAPKLESSFPIGKEVLDLNTPKCPVCKELFSSQRTPARQGEQTREICAQFRRFLSGPETMRRLRLQFGPPTPRLCRAHWVSLDLNVVEQRARDAGTATLEIPDDYFDRVLCTGLEAVSRPITLITDVFRIVKPGGHVWIQTPSPRFHAIPKNDMRRTYWCITARGLRVLLQNFQELASSVQLEPESRLQGESFYFGKKCNFDIPAR